MDIFYSILLSLSLCIDTFTIAVVIGICNNLNFIKASKISLIFSTIQSIAPLIGWSLGFAIKEIFIQLDHWIAFIILITIGVKMILNKKNGIECSPRISLKYIVTCGITTSIDAFAIGFTISLINISVIYTITILGIITYLTGIIGIFIGKKVNKIIRIKYLEITGGLILILLGVKILIEHIFNLNFI